MDEHWHLTEMESIGGHRTEIVSAPELVDIEAGPAVIAALTDPDSIRARRALFDLCLLGGLNYRQAQEMARSNRELRASCCY